MRIQSGKGKVYLRLCLLAVLASCASKDNATEEPVAGDENAATDETGVADDATQDQELDKTAGNSGNAANAQEATPANAAAESTPVAETPAGEPSETSVPNTEAVKAVAAPVAAAPVAEAPAAHAEAAVVSEPAEAVAEGSTLVMYIKIKSAKVYASPDSKAQVVAQLEKGDHMLVTVEGGWAKLSTNGYIELKSLSSKAVGRPRRGGNWKS